MEKIMFFNYPSSVSQIVEANESFDSCVLQICYHGINKNKTELSKEVIEKAIPSLYNCPIVCNYNVADDTIGSHDVEIVNTPNGLRMVNRTDAVGVIPSGARWYWATKGTGEGAREYLCVEAILWKRASVYEKLKRDGIESQSMEITVKSGERSDGILHIGSFIFTAFCLLGDDVEPCFEDAHIETFSLEKMKLQYSNMMNDLKKYFSVVNSSQEVDINSNLSKGGNTELNKTELLGKYGLTLKDVNFDIDKFSNEELEEKFAEIKKNKEKAATAGEDDIIDEPKSPDSEPEPEPEPEPGEPSGGDDTGDENQGGNQETPEQETSNQSGDQNDPEQNSTQNYTLLAEQLRDGLRDALRAVKYTDPCGGVMSKYGYVDHDTEIFEVYCYDYEDWKLYGFLYAMNGDNVVIDFDSKKRKKFIIVDFDEGNADADYKYAFERRESDVISAKESDYKCKYDSAVQKINQLNAEVETLKAYQKAKMDEEHEAEADKLFAKFPELDGVEAFEALRSDHTALSLNEIESKCYELRGRNTNVTFSLNKPKTVRLAAVGNTDNEAEPYGGIFEKYPPQK